MSCFASEQQQKFEVWSLNDQQMHHHEFHASFDSEERLRRLGASALVPLRPLRLRRCCQRNDLCIRNLRKLRTTLHSSNDFFLPQQPWWGRWDWCGWCSWLSRRLPSPLILVGDSSWRCPWVLAPPYHQQVTSHHLPPSTWCSAKATAMIKL